MALVHEQDGLPPVAAPHGADRGAERPPSGAGAAFLRPGAAVYGRHAAPLSAYGPADVGRLLPVPAPVPGATEGAALEDAFAEVADVRADGGEAEDRSAGQAASETTGFWARLRLLSRTA